MNINIIVVIIIINYIITIHIIYIMSCIVRQISNSNERDISIKNE